MRPGAEEIFGLVCIEKIWSLSWVCRLFENFILKRLFFSIGSKSYRKLTKSKVGVPLFVWVLVKKKFLV